MAIFAGRKLVCDPPAVGSTAVCVAAPEMAEELEGLSRQFISRVSYKGIGSLEFKRDSKAGKFVIVEPTVGRTDWQEEIATLCGINIPLITYWTELERTLKGTLGESARFAWRSSLGHRLPRAASMSQVRAIDGYLRLGDPLPGLYYYVIERLVKRVYVRANRILGIRPRVGSKKPASWSNSADGTTPPCP